MGIFRSNSESGKSVATFPERWNQIETSIAEALGVQPDVEFSGVQVLQSSQRDQPGGFVGLNQNAKIPLSRIVCSQQAAPWIIPLTQPDGTISGDFFDPVSVLGQCQLSRAVTEYGVFPGDSDNIGSAAQNCILRVGPFNQDPSSEFQMVFHNQSYGMNLIRLDPGYKYFVSLRCDLLRLKPFQGQPQVREIAFWAEHIMRGTRSNPTALIWHDKEVVMANTGGGLAIPKTVALNTFLIVQNTPLWLLAWVYNRTFPFPPEEGFAYYHFSCWIEAIVARAAI